MNHKPQLVVLSLVFVLFAFTFASAQSVPQLAQKALAATVFLTMQNENGDTLKYGSGFFVRENLIATNFHVIDGATQGGARLVNKTTTYSIEGVTAIDEENDLALLKVTVPGITPLPLGDSGTVNIGDPIYVVGNPKQLEGTFSDGIISGLREFPTRKVRLQMTAPISRGSSGGPVLDRKGEVVGVSTSIYNSPWAQNLNFAVPSKVLQALLVQSGEAKPLWYDNKTVSYSKYLLRGYERMSSTDYEVAIREFTHAIHLTPNDAAGYVGRGRAELGIGQHSAALMDFDEVIRLAPNEVEAYVRRGNAKAALGQQPAAILGYDATVRLDPYYTATIPQLITIGELLKTNYVNTPPPFSISMWLSA